MGSDVEVFRGDPKYPSDDLPYGFIFTARAGPNNGTRLDKGWLQGAQIVSSAWSILEGDNALILHDDSHDTTSTWVYVADGTGGMSYLLANDVSTNEIPPRYKRFLMQVLVKPE